MTRDSIDEFVAGWIDAWNRRDVEAVLEHFANDVEFVSPTAASVVGNPLVTGKDALRAYWVSALERIGNLKFTLDRAPYDVDRREVSIVYSREIDGARDRACELLTFDAAGLVIRGEVMHGVKEA
jgi:ketosteroid isomerase-like protein